MYAQYRDSGVLFTEAPKTGSAKPQAPSTLPEGIRRSLRAVARKLRNVNPQWKHYASLCGVALATLGLFAAHDHSQTTVRRALGDEPWFNLGRPTWNIREAPRPVSRDEMSSHSRQSQDVGATDLLHNDPKRPTPGRVEKPEYLEDQETPVAPKSNMRWLYKHINTKQEDRIPVTPMELEFSNDDHYRKASFKADGSPIAMAGTPLGDEGAGPAKDEPSAPTLTMRLGAVLLPVLIIGEKFIQGLPTASQDTNLNETLYEVLRACFFVFTMLLFCYLIGKFSGNHYLTCGMMTVATSVYLLDTLQAKGVENTDGFVQLFQVTSILAVMCLGVLFILSTQKLFPKARGGNTTMGYIASGLVAIGATLATTVQMMPHGLGEIPADALQYLSIVGVFVALGGLALFGFAFAEQQKFYDFWIVYFVALGGMALIGYGSFMKFSAQAVVETTSTTATTDGTHAAAEAITQSYDLYILIGISILVAAFVFFMITKTCRKEVA